MRTLWPSVPLVAVAIGVAILAIPARLEGPALVPISPGHALSLVDTIGVVPLVTGALCLHAGLWRRRDALRTRGTLGFVAGLGLGLLLASAFSAFFWWWAIGAVVFSAANVAAIVAALRAGRIGA